VKKPGRIKVTTGITRPILNSNLKNSIINSENAIKIHKQAYRS
jgi:hypothetical protein